jgi:hypothetical protein
MNRRLGRFIAAAATPLALVAAAGTAVFTGASSAQAATSAPCDIYASGGTPCVAAHSTTRALHSSYNGPLYQVRRASDTTTKGVGVLSAGGYVNTATQDSFCANTGCVIIREGSAQSGALSTVIDGARPSGYNRRRTRHPTAAARASAWRTGGTGRGLRCMSRSSGSLPEGFHAGG